MGQTTMHVGDVARSDRTRKRDRLRRDVLDRWKMAFAAGDPSSISITRHKRLS